VKIDSAFEDHCRKNNIPHFSFPFKNAIDIHTAFRVKKICLENAIDLIHMHSSKSHGIGVLSAVLGNETPMILSRRVDFVPKDKWFTKWKYNHPCIKKILCVSDKITEIMSSYVSRTGLCLTVHSGVDITRFRTRPNKNLLKAEFGLPAETLLIGNTSALEDHKDYFTFINTLEILIKNNRPVKGFIIGKGSLEASLRDYVNEKGLKEAIVFTGFRNNIEQLLPCLDIFLMTSKEEGLGTSILDAFLAAVPVVATRAGGIPEMVIHEKTGMLAPAGDAHELALHCEKIISDELFRSHLMSEAKQKVLEFSKEQTAQKTLAIYREVLSQNPAVN
jgi:glycosyltransferase involved in cell wall biosynthesis